MRTNLLAGLLIAFAFYTAPIYGQQNPDLGRMLATADSFTRALESVEETDWVNPATARDWARLVWATMEHSQRLEPAAFQSVARLERYTAGADSQLTHTQLLYTLAHQADYEKAWGQAAVYQFQREQLLTAWYSYFIQVKNYHRLPDAEISNHLNQFQAQVARIAPQHLEFMRFIIIAETGLGKKANPAAYWETLDTYITNQLSDPQTIARCIRLTYDSQKDPQCVRLAFKWADKMKQLGDVCAAELEKFTLYILLADDAEAKKQKEVCRACVVGNPAHETSFKFLCEIY